MVKEKIFISSNPVEANILENLVIRAFKPIATVEKILDENGIPVTLDVIRACLTMSKKRCTRAIEQQPMVSVDDTPIPQYVEPYEVMTNCDALDNAIENVIKKAIKAAPNKREKDRIEKDMRDDFEMAKRRYMDVFISTCYISTHHNF